MKQCLNCKKPLYNNHPKAKFCCEECGKIHRRRMKISNDITKLNKECQYESYVCHDRATAILNKQFYCKRHFTIMKTELKHKLTLLCLNCSKPFQTTKIALRKKFCCDDCKTAYRERKEAEND